MKRLLCLLFAIALLLCGCAERAEDKERRVEAVVDSRSDKEVTIASYRPDTLCPLFTRVNANAQMLNLVFDSLIVCENDMTASPLLANSWSVSEDGLAWRIELGHAKWHDGSAFSAEDVVYTINAIKARADSMYYKNTANILKVTGEGSGVDIKLKVPQPNFINLLYFPIIKQNSATGENFNPVGTGSFKFDTDEAPEGGYVLNRNMSSVRGVPAIQRITIKLLPDKDTNVFAFASKDVDIAGVSDVDWASRVNTAEVNSCVFSTGRYNFLGFNHNSEFLKDVLVRRAVALAVDNKKIVDNVLYGQGTPANTPVSREWRMYAEEDGEGFNPELAKELLIEAGFEQGEDNMFWKLAGGRKQTLTLELLVNADNVVRELVAARIVEDLQGFGIKVNIKKAANDEYLRLIDNRRFDVVLAEVDILADVDLGFMLGKGNVWGYDDASMAELLDPIQGTDYAGIQEKYKADAVGVGLYFKKDVLLYSKHIQSELRPVFHNIYRGLF